MNRRPPRTVRDLVPPDDAVLLQALLETDPDYSRRVSGGLPDPGEGMATLTAVPSGFSPAGKHVLGLFEGARLVAVADVLRGYPGPDTAFIGLLLVYGTRRDQGLGRAMHDEVVRLVSGWEGVTTLRLAVLDANAEAAAGFWERLGYRPTGEIKPWHHGESRSMACLYERGV